MILISKEQFQTGGMQVSEVNMQNFNEEVKCNGYILASKTGFAQISSPVSGIVESIHYSLNDYVIKGKVLFQLLSDDFMTLQHDYAESSAKKEKLRADYERIKALYAESIQAKKDFITIESEYKAIQAKNYTARLRLEQMGLNVSRIDAGEFYTSFPVIAPINGYIVTQNLAIGQFIEPQKVLSEMVDTDQLQLQLSVFENDISKLKTGQTVQFESLRQPGIHSAVLISMGKNIDTDTKTILCIAQITKDRNAGFINKSYVNASVCTNRLKLKALPNEAILKAGNDNFVLQAEGMKDNQYQFKKVKVTPGLQSNAFTEIKDLPLGVKVLSKGAYYLSSQ
jgi:cobalt-zinc-cadmium efflux system membrane fusion protein